MTILSKLEKNFDLFKIKVKKEIKGKVEFSHSLAKYTSWRVGGDGDIVFWPDDLADLQKFLAILNYDLVDMPKPESHALKFQNSWQAMALLKESFYQEYQELLAAH